MMAGETPTAMAIKEERPAAAAGAMAAPTVAGASAFLSNPVSGASTPSARQVTTGKVGQTEYQSSLTAGQVNDNAKFDDYLDYAHSYQGPPVHTMLVEQRLFVRVVDGKQQPIAGARVQVFDGNRQVFDGSTVSDGRVLFFPGIAGSTQARQFRAVVGRGHGQVESVVKAGGPEQTVSLAGVKDNTGSVNLDLVFLLDATGSMDDEIDKIEGTVDSIAARIEQLPGSSKPRFGLVANRDRGDDYVTRS